MPDMQTKSGCLILMGFFLFKTKKAFRGDTVMLLRIVYVAEEAQCNVLYAAWESDVSVN